jgi:hypothetical protein
LSDNQKKIVDLVEKLPKDLTDIVDDIQAKEVAKLKDNAIAYGIISKDQAIEHYVAHLWKSDVPANRTRGAEVSFRQHTARSLER